MISSFRSSQRYSLCLIICPAASVTFIAAPPTSMSRSEIRPKLPKDSLIDGRGITCIGWCFNRRENTNHVASLLHRAGIQPFMEGSCAIDIWVLDGELNRAVRLLSQDPDGDRHGVTLYKVEPAPSPVKSPRPKQAGSRKSRRGSTRRKL